LIPAATSIGSAGPTTSTGGWYTSTNARQATSATAATVGRTHAGVATGTRASASPTLDGRTDRKPNGDVSARERATGRNVEGRVSLALASATARGTDFHASWPLARRSRTWASTSPGAICGKSPHWIGPDVPARLSTSRRPRTNRRAAVSATTVSGCGPKPTIAISPV
jgi:hypothetical protein